MLVNDPYITIFQIILVVHMTREALGITIFQIILVVHMTREALGLHSLSFKVQ
jgi:hypothetical protein